MDFDFLVRTGLVVITGIFVVLGIYAVFFTDEGLLGGLFG